MNEIEVIIVQHYINEYLFEPTSSWPKESFEERSHARWAAFEIMHRLMDFPFDSPDMIVEAFILELTMYLYLAKDEKTTKLFSVAKDTAEDILCLVQ